MKSPTQLILALLGPTASGKTELALKLADALSAEIICLDSTTLYRHFNIGTSKPDPLSRAKIPHHLVDICDPLEPFSAFDFVKRAESTLEEVIGGDKIPILVGGSYFYLKSLQNGLFDVPAVETEVVEEIEREFDPQENPLKAMHEKLSELDPLTAKKIHPQDRYRMLRALSIIRSTGKLPSTLFLKKPQSQENPRVWVKYAVLKSRHDLTQSIALRTDKMLSQGLIEETKNLLENFPGAKALSSIGYAECVKYLSHQIDLKQLRNEIIEKTRQLAKRQMTWLRSDPEIRFVDERDEKRIIFEINQLKEALR